MLLCIFQSTKFEETFESSPRRKISNAAKRIVTVGNLKTQLKKLNQDNNRTNAISVTYQWGNLKCYPNLF